MYAHKNTIKTNENLKETKENVKMKSLIYSTFREGYGPDQVRKTMTVGELIALLEDYDEDTPVYLSFDNGYTYGGSPTFFNSKGS